VNVAGAIQGAFAPTADGSAPVAAADALALWARFALNTTADALQDSNVTLTADDPSLYVVPSASPSASSEPLGGNLAAAGAGAASPETLAATGAIGAGVLAASGMALCCVGFVLKKRKKKVEAVELEAGVEIKETMMMMAERIYREELKAGNIRYRNASGVGDAGGAGAENAGADGGSSIAVSSGARPTLRVTASSRVLTSQPPPQPAATQDDKDDSFETTNPMIAVRSSRRLTPAQGAAEFAPVAANAPGAGAGDAATSEAKSRISRASSSRGLTLRGPPAAAAAAAAPGASSLPASVGSSRPDSPKSVGSAGSLSALGTLGTPPPSPADLGLGAAAAAAALAARAPAPLAPEAVANAAAERAGEVPGQFLSHQGARAQAVTNPMTALQTASQRTTPTPGAAPAAFAAPPAPFTAAAPAAPIASTAAVSASTAALSAVVARLNIRPDLARKLPQVGNFDIALVLDDSGSMSQPFPGGTTRWAHLFELATSAVDLCRATAAPPRPIDVFFLNRAAVPGVTDSSQLREPFAAKPRGFTPLTRVFKQALATGRAADGSRVRKLLIIVMTDGLPTDDDGDDDVEPFLTELRALPSGVHVQLTAFAEASECLHYVQEIDKELDHLDVSDLYPLQRERMLAQHRRVNAGSDAGFAFSVGDFIARALLAPIDAEIAALSEVAPAERPATPGSDADV